MQDNLTVYDKLKTYCRRNGHTFIHCPGKKNLTRLVQHKCKDRGKTQMFLCRDTVRAARCEPRHNTSTSKDLPSLYLWRYWDAEKKVAKYMKQIITGEDRSHDGMYLPKLDAEDWEGLDDSQKTAVEYIRSKPLTILSGMGGCGKTTVIAKLVTTYFQHRKLEQERKLLPDGSSEELERKLLPNVSSEELDRKLSPDDISEEPEILLTAPTGKAASLLGKKCDLSSHTIHSVIYSHMVWKKTVKYEYSEAKWKFASTEMLVVDECSMVAVTIIARLLEILLKDSRLCKVVLVGDIRQLPSIEPGNFFEDTFKIAEEQGLGVDLKTNHRVDEGGKSIVKNAKRISRMKMPKFDEETYTLPKESGCRFHLLRIDSDVRDVKEEGKFVWCSQFNYNVRANVYNVEKVSYF